jgi:hypothetical protein
MRMYTTLDVRNSDGKRILEGPRYGWKNSPLGSGTSHHVLVFIVFLLLIFGIF